MKQVGDKFSDALNVRKITSAAAAASSSSDDNASSSSSVPGRAMTGGTANMAAFRATLWNNVEAATEALHNK